MKEPVTINQLTAFRQAIESDIAQLNNRVGKVYDIGSLPQEDETIDWKPNDIASLRKIREALEIYQQKFRQYDQHMLSMYHRAINGKAALTEELKSWWMSRY